MSRKLFITILALLGIISLVVILKTPLARKAMAGILPGLHATKEPFDPFKDEIAFMEKELQRTDLSSDERQFLLDKFSSEFLSATQRARGLEHRSTRPVLNVATPTNDTGGYKIPDGIDDHPSVPISESVVTVFNSWRKTTEDRYFLVFAGVLTTDSKQGAILILHTNYRFYQYNTPTKNGGVKVIAENGTVITLQSTDGTTFYFDASQETFIDENGKPIPVNKVASPTSSIRSESTQATLPAYP
jgi:hypothetical protein